MEPTCSRSRTMLSLQCDVNTKQRLQALRERSELCDVVIVCSDGSQTCAHSCVLACHSTVIAEVLQNRLSAEQDWSILRPLIINIDEVSVKTVDKQDPFGVNVVEMLISLMYGQIVNVSSIHIPELKEYAQVLGLSEQIFSCLTQGRNDHSLDVDQKLDKKLKLLDEKSPVKISIPFHKDDLDEYEHVAELNEYTLANQIFPSDVSQRAKRFSTGHSVFDSKNNSENVLSFSMLSPDGQEEGDSLTYETDVQNQECNVILKTDDCVSVKPNNKRGNVTDDLESIFKITLKGQSSPDKTTVEQTSQQQSPKKPPAKKAFSCTVCSSAFHKSTDLVKHIQNMQHFTVQCPLCFIQIQETEGQKVHFALHNEDLPFFCLYCDKRFRTRAALTMHKPKHMTSKPDDVLKEVSNGKLLFHIIEKGTQKAKRMLIDSRDFTYTIKRQKSNKIFWVCSRRSKVNRCPATVSQINNTFNPGSHEHNHEPKKGGFTSRIMASRIREEALKDADSNASAIVDKVVTECADLEDPNYDLLFHNNLIRKTNRTRQRHRNTATRLPPVDFELNLDFMPTSFMKDEIIIGEERHLIFATQNQLSLMASAKTWYLDGSCSLECEPFQKIFSILTYVTSGINEVQMIPLCFVAMSRCYEKDYREVLGSLVYNHLNSTNVELVIADFERCLWRAMSAIIPQIEIKGCAYHWGKFVWNKAHKNGFKIDMMEEDYFSQRIIHQTLALPFLPVDCIEKAFQHLCSVVKDNKKFNPLMETIGSSLISNPPWTIESWCCFKSAIITSHDVDGWYRSIKRQLLYLNPIFYNIVWLLLQESEDIDSSYSLVSEDDVVRYQKRDVISLKRNIFNLWESYQTDDTPSDVFLTECGELFSAEII